MRLIVFWVNCAEKKTIKRLCRSDKSSMSRKTDSDDEAVHFQMDRLVQQNGEWYYITREGEERGPFESREDAEGDLIFYIRDCHQREIYSGK